MSTLSDRAMLVSLSVSVWTARKHDRRGDATVDREYGSDRAGRFNKALIAEDALHAVQAAVTAARTYHYAHTLPWSDQGQRVLPSSEFLTYSAELRTHRAAFDRAVDEFAAGYDALVDDARVRLNGLFRQADYPTDVRSAFGWNVTILPIPAGSDFRVDLGAAQVAEIRQQIEDSTRIACATAHADLARRLIDALGRMAERLDQQDAIFRDSLVTNLAELAELLPRLNLFGDAALDGFCRDVAAKLCRYTPETLRTAPTVRAEVARDANEILRAMGALYGNP